MTQSLDRDWNGLLAELASRGALDALINPPWDSPGKSAHSDLPRRRKSALPKFGHSDLPPPGGLLTTAQAAARLNCSTKTLKAHVAAGELKYVTIGKGSKRPRKFFTVADLNQFIANQTRKDIPCPSTASRARHTGTSTSSGTVIDFTAPRKPPTDDKRKK